MCSTYRWFMAISVHLLWHLNLWCSKQGASLSNFNSLFFFSYRPWFSCFRSLLVSSRSGNLDLRSWSIRSGVVWRCHSLRLTKPRGDRLEDHFYKILHRWGVWTSISAFVTRLWKEWPSILWLWTIVCKYWTTTSSTPNDGKNMEEGGVRIDVLIESCNSVGSVVAQLGFLYYVIIYGVVWMMN